MEPQKVYLNEKDEATIVCGSCGKQKTINAQRYMDSFKAVNVKCTCGFIFPITFEKRKYYRKRVRISGVYAVLEGSRETGHITIKDLSRTGLAFETQNDHQMKIGQLVKIRFALDDSDKTLITKTVEIKNVDGRRIGARFGANDFPKALAFYLMP